MLVAQLHPSLQPHGLYNSLPGSSVHGILQASILEWVAIPFSRKKVFSKKVFFFFFLNL